MSVTSWNPGGSTISAGEIELVPSKLPGRRGIVAACLLLSSTGCGVRDLRRAPVHEKVGVKHMITMAFNDVEPPCPWAIAGSTEGDEPKIVECAFRDQCDWKTIQTDLLNSQAGAYAL